MEIVKLLEKLKAENKPVVIDGITGRIVDFEQGVLTLESIRKKSGKEGGYLKETTYHPIANISVISQGEKEIPKSEQETQIAKELEALV